MENSGNIEYVFARRLVSENLSTVNYAVKKIEFKIWNSKSKHVHHIGETFYEGATKNIPMTSLNFSRDYHYLPKHLLFHVHYVMLVKSLNSEFRKSTESWSGDEVGSK